MDRSDDDPHHTASGPPDPRVERALLGARALVLRDLRAAGLERADVVSTLEDAVAARRWWVSEWPQGAAFVPGLVAQDVQEALMAVGERWPQCAEHTGSGEDHPLYLEPELGEDPHWVCERTGRAVAPLGALPALG